MKNINKYATLAAYTADSNRPTTESTVSSIVENKIIKFDGKNIVVDKPASEVGDIAVYDTNTKTRRFIKFSTFNLATLPANLVIAGVVYSRTNDKVYVVAKDNFSEQWAAPYQVKLSGFDFATGGSFTITVNTTTTAAIDYLTTDTLATVAPKIMTALTNAGFTSATGWSVTVVSDHLVVNQNWYTPNVTIFNITDASNKVVKLILTGTYQTTSTGFLYQTSSAFRNDGSVTYFAGANYLKFLSYYEVSGSEDINQTVGSVTVIRRSSFTVEKNPLLVAYYTTYEKYIEAKMARHPYSKGTIIDNDGKGNTYKLSQVTYLDSLSAYLPAYPAANRANLYGISYSGHTTGYEPGNWWLPSSREFFNLMKNVTWGNVGVVAGGEDIVNRAITMIGGTRVSAGSSHWTSSEDSSIDAWIYNGTLGNLNYGNKYYSISVRPITAF